MRRLGGSSIADPGMMKIQQFAVDSVEIVLSGKNLTLVLQALWHQNPLLSSQQRGAIQDIIYGVLRYLGRLEAILGQLAKRSLPDKRLRNLLLVSLYQLNYSKAPHYAVVDCAVATTRKLTKSKGAVGLVNAILRNFLRNNKSLLDMTDTHETGRFSHPQWWIDKLKYQYPQQYEAILLANNRHPPMTLRVNRLRTSIADYQALLNQCEIENHQIWDNALMLSKPVPAQKLPMFEQGYVSIQDAGAQLAASFLDVGDGMNVLDACAAPGGKSTHLMEIADLQLTVMDSDQQRLVRVSENFKRLGIEPFRQICGDATSPFSWWDGKPFDRILADVPCSASGVVSRHPDIKWLRRISDLPMFVNLQQNILEALWLLLKSEGKLLYVTCSVFVEENCQQVKSFLDRHPDARLLPITHAEINNGQLLPNCFHDGFYYALFYKL